MCPNRKINRHDGFSMIELMISMATMTIVTGAAFALIGSSLKFSSATYNTIDAEQNLRTAHEFINRDLATAGDGLKGINMIQAPPAFVSNYLTRTPIIDAGSTNPNLGLVTSDDNVPGTTAVPQASPAVNVLAGSDRLTLLTKDSNFNAVPVLVGKITVAGSNTTIAIAAADMTSRGFQAGEIYAVVAQNSIAFGVISSVNTTTNTLIMTNGDSYGLNQTVSTAPISTVAGVVSGASTQGASIIRLQIIHYYVDANNLLVRRVFGVKGQGFVDSIVAEHVTNLQFRYLLNLVDPNTGFVLQPKRQLASSTEQAAVREVETAIGVETLRAVNAVTANNTGKQVVSSTTATAVRNLQFRKAL